MDRRPNELLLIARRQCLEKRCAIELHGHQVLRDRSEVLIHGCVRGAFHAPWAPEERRERLPRAIALVLTKVPYRCRGRGGEDKLPVCCPDPIILRPESHRGWTSVWMEVDVGAGLADEVRQEVSRQVPCVIPLAKKPQLLVAEPSRAPFVPWFEVFAPLEPGSFITVFNNASSCSEYSGRVGGRRRGPSAPVWSVRVSSCRRVWSK